MQLKRTIHTGLNWLGNRREARGGVLLYHRVAEPELDPFNLCVSPANFERQLALIAESGRALSLHEFMERKNKGELERGSVCLTFDDGYLDVLTEALPLLEAYEIPATLFVTTGNLGEAFWWDRLAALVYGSSTLPGTLLLEPTQSSPFPVENLSMKGLYDLLYPILRSAGSARRELILSTLASQLDGAERLPPPRCASARELSEAAKHPLLTIGAHTVTHSRLSSLDYRSQLREMTESIDTVSSIIGRKVDTLSYPFGLENRDFDMETVTAAKEAGVRYGFAADLNAVTHQTNDLAVPRLWVHNKGENAVRFPLQLWTGATLPSSIGLPS